MMTRRRLNTPTRIFLSFVFIFALWLAGLHWFTRDIVSPPAPAARQKADAIVVLTGGSNRLQTGFDLFEAGLGQKVFISGVYRGVEVRELLTLWKTEAAEGLQDAVTLGFDADDTIGNALETTAWLKTQGFKSFYLVTSNYHLRRALLEFSRVAPGYKITPYPVVPEGLDMQNWWRNEAHRALIIKEYMKYLATLVRLAVMV